MTMVKSSNDSDGRVFVLVIKLSDGECDEAVIVNRLRIRW